MVVLRAKSGRLPEALNQVEEILRTRRHVAFSEPNNFDVKTADAFITQFDSIFGMIGMIAIAIAKAMGTQIVRLSRRGDEKMPAPGTVTGVGVGLAAAIACQIT